MNDNHAGLIPSKPLAEYIGKVKDYIGKLEEKLAQTERYLDLQLKVKDAMSQQLRRAEDRSAREADSTPSHSVSCEGRSPADAILDRNTKVIEFWYSQLKVCTENDFMLNKHKTELLERLGKARADLRKAEGIQADSQVEGES